MNRSNISCLNGGRSTSTVTVKNTEAAGAQTSGMTDWREWRVTRTL